MIFHIYKTMMANYTSFEVCENTDILAYVDYLIFSLDNKEEIPQESEMSD